MFTNPVLSYNKGIFYIYPYMVTYLDSGVSVVNYTKDKTMYNNLERLNPNVSDLKVSNTVLDEKQQERLDKLNTLKTPEADGMLYILEFTNFVMYGYIKEETKCVQLASLYEEYKNASKEHFLNILLEVNKAIRKEKESAGVKYGDVIVDTDRECQASLTSSVTMLKAKLAKTVDFKCRNNQYLLNQTLKDILTLSSTVACYTQTCYSVEAMVSTYLSGLSVRELVELSINKEQSVLAIYNDTFAKAYPIAMEKAKESLQEAINSIEE